jgi:hypothetical protein
MHDKAVIGSDFEKEWYLPGPDGEIASVVITKFAGDGGNVVNEAKVFEGEELRRRCWVDVKIWEREISRLVPTFNFCLNLWGPEQVCFLGGCSSFFLNWHVHIWTTTVVLRAVSALGEVLVTTNVSAFASFTALPRFGMAPTRRSTTRASHLDEAVEKEDRTRRGLNE